MDRHLTIIPLRMTPYSDRYSILSAYSRELGRVSCLVRSASGSGVRKRGALLMPMCPVKCVVSVVAGRDVMPLREPVPYPPLPMISADPVRCTLALFISDVLLAVLRQSGSEPELYDFIADASSRLNEPGTSLANFHLCFLVGLLGHLGVSPDLGGFHGGMVFDMVDACFRVSTPVRGRVLMPDEARAAFLLGKMTWQNLHLYKYTRAQRARALDLILEYYSLHVVNLNSLKSVAVLRELFD